MKPKVNLVLAVIFLIGLLVRIYKLEQIPYGLHVDEIKAGWNAVSILETLKDDKSNLLPLYYDSFGDFRPAGLIYLIIPTVIIFGKTILAIRLPLALLGALTVFPIYLIVREISKKKDRRMALLAAGLLAVNPWHIIMSRATAEGVAAMFLALWGIYYLIITIKKPNLKYSLISIISFAGAYFFYHSIRALAPMLIVAIIISYKNLKNKGYRLRQAVIVLAMMILISAGLLVSKNGAARMQQVSLKSDFRVLYEITKMPNEEGPNHVFTARAFHNRIVSLARVFADEYKNYFGTNFLVGNTGKPIRYTVPQVGILTFAELILIIFGLFQMKSKKELPMIFILLLLAPLPAAVTNEDTPNMVRSMFMIPFLVIFMAYGVDLILRIKKLKMIGILAAGALTVNFIYFGHMYLNHQNQSLATYYRDGGNVELASEISKLKNNYKKIILTNSPDDLYPWIAYIGNYRAFEFNKSYLNKIDNVRTFENLIFSCDKCPSLKAMEDKSVTGEEILYADAEGCTPSLAMSTLYEITDIKVISRPDGSPPYVLRTVALKTDGAQVTAKIEDSSKQQPGN